MAYSAQGAFAQQMLGALQLLWQQARLPAWLGLAMALHESGAPPAADSTFAIQGNPWGVRCFQAQYQCVNDFQVYPSLTAAAQSLIVALGSQRLQYVSDPAAFMQNLQATGWDGPAPASNGYADSVLYTFGPIARSALAEIGADQTTGAVAGGGGGTGSGRGYIYQTSPAAGLWTFIGVVAAFVGASSLATHPLRQQEHRQARRAAARPGSIVGSR